MQIQLFAGGDDEADAGPDRPVPVPGPQRKWFGAARYDAVLLGLITYILTPEQNTAVFRRAFRALRPGGKLVIDAIMAADRPAEWASRATLLMSVWNGGAAHAFADYRTWLRRVGFGKIRQHNEHLLSAVK